MKNLANCTPREFMRQTAKIRHAVEKWLTLTDIMNIRKRMAEMPTDATTEERKRLQEQQAKANLRAMFDAILDEHPDETADLLALCCFVEPEEAESHPMSEYIGAAADMVFDENVMRFFMSLLRWGQNSGLLA